MKKIFLLLNLVIGFTCFAQSFGIDELGIAKYIDVALKGHAKGTPLGAFTSTFGDAKPAIEKMLKRGDIPLFKLNLSWKDNHSFSRKDFPAIVKEAKRFAPLFIKYPTPACYFNGATEHNLSLADAKELANQVLAVIPSRCQYVNNPMQNKGKLIPTNERILNEIHGKENPPSGRFGYSFDGTSSVDSNVTAIKQKMKNAEYFLMWHPANNGRLKADDPTPRPQRKSFPTVELLESLQVLAKDKGATNLDSKWLFKSHADRHTTPPEPRAYKPVIIGPTKNSNIKVGDTTCSYYGVYQGGGHRYYCPKYGYKIANKPVNILIGQKKIGIINPAFREGGFR